MWGRLRWAPVLNRHWLQKQNSRLFRINSLGGNCSHVVDKYTSYTYPCLPVGLSCQKRRFGPQKLSYFTYLYYMQLSYFQYKSSLFPAPQNDVKEQIPPRAGRGGLGTRIPSLLRRIVGRRGKRQRNLDGEKTKVTRRSRNGKEGGGTETPPRRRTGHRAHCPINRSILTPRVVIARLPCEAEAVSSAQFPTPVHA